MSFLSMNFLLFLSVAILGYYVIPKRLQWVWLLLLPGFGDNGRCIHPGHDNHHIPRRPDFGIYGREDGQGT